MIGDLHQGSILKIENIKNPVLVVSKDFFNNSGQVIVCPILQGSADSPLHIYVKTEGLQGFVHCEKLKMLDMKIRGYKGIGNINLEDRIDISDAIQGIFDYV